MVTHRSSAVERRIPNRESPDSKSREPGFSIEGAQILNRVSPDSQSREPRFSIPSAAVSKLGNFCSIAFSFAPHHPSALRSSGNILP